MLRIELKIRLFTVNLFVVLSILFFLAACSSSYTLAGNNVTSTAFVPTSTPPKITPTPTSTTAILVSIDVEPVSADLTMGSERQFTAIAIYSDGSTEDVTSNVTWQSNSTGVNISPTGLASGLATGTALIEANLYGITSMPALITLVDAVPTTIPVTTTTPATTTVAPTTTSTPATTPATTTVIPTTTSPTTTTTTPTTVTSTPTTHINPTTGVCGNYYLGLINTPNGTLSGDGCYDDTGDFIVLINNKNAINPTYAQLVSFLQSDTTDEYPYMYTNRVGGSYYGTAESHVDLQNIQNIIDGITQPKNPDVCADFAERIHNDAEMDGIKCAYVCINLSTGGHAIDAFQTTDKGLIYVDDTGVPASTGPSRCVRTVSLAVGQEYLPMSLFPQSGWGSWYSMGTVISFQVYWDGTWNN